MASTAPGQTAEEGYPIERGTMLETRAVEWNHTDMTRAGSRLPILRMAIKAPAAHTADTIPKTVPYAIQSKRLGYIFWMIGYD